jgi:hypothetical protein
LVGERANVALLSSVLKVPAVIVALLVSQSILSGQNVQIAFSHAGVAAGVIGAGFYLTVLGVFALGLEAIAGSTGWQAVSLIQEAPHEAFLSFPG